MPDLAALVAALSVMQDPASSRLARRAALPRGMTFLLEIAAGDDEALAHARAVTGRDDVDLRDAASFFIEQVMFTGRGSLYRVLGATSDADPRDLRRHMSLLMKWVHPDAAPHNSLDQTLDRSVFAARITEAWQTLKSEERRSSYDATLSALPPAEIPAAAAPAGASKPQRSGSANGLSKVISRLFGRAT